MIRYKRAASNDSQETADIMEESNNDSGRAEAGGEAGTRQGQQVWQSGHHDPKQRQIYLALLAFSVSCAFMGLTLLLVWMYKYRSVTGLGISDAAQLANLHPIMMYTFMVSLNMYAVLVYRTHYSQAKERLKWTHAILSGGNMVMSLLGVFAMFKAHQMSNIPNFYSLHSWIGSLTNGFYVTQFIGGFVAFLRPGLAERQRTLLMPWHRFLGALILVLASCAAITGIGELVIFQDKDGLYSKFTPITFIANFAGISILLMTAVSIYLLTASHYLRPRLPEEQPLKR